MCNKKGMTLIELVAVLGVLCIISYMSFPTIGVFRHKNQHMLLEIASKELLCDLRFAQEMARSEGFVCHVYLNNMDNSYMVYSLSDMKSTIYKNKELPEGIGFDNVRSTYEDSKISFDERGKPLPYPCTVALINSLGQYKKITITVATDYISIKEI